MLFNEYLEITTFNEWFKTYDFLFKYVQKKLGLWSVVYDVQTCDYMISSILDENTLELSKIRTLLDNAQIISDREAWANKAINETISDMKSNNIASSSNVGYNVEGENSKQQADSFNEASSTNNMSTIKLIDEYIKLNNTNMYSVFQNIINDFNSLIISFIPMKGGS